MWFLHFVNRSSNSCAHNIASWLRNIGVNGTIDVSTIPPEVLCDKGGTNVQAVEADLFNAWFPIYQKKKIHQSIYQSRLMNLKSISI